MIDTVLSPPNSEGEKTSVFFHYAELFPILTTTSFVSSRLITEIHSLSKTRE